MPPVSMAATGVPEGQRLEQHPRERLGPERREHEGAPRGPWPGARPRGGPSPRRCSSTPAAAASNFSAWASEPSPSTTRGSPVRAAAHRGHQQARALVLLELAHEQEEPLGQGHGGRRCGDGRGPRPASTMFGSTSTRGRPGGAQLARRWPRSPPGSPPRGARARRFSRRSRPHVGMAAQERGAVAWDAALDAAGHGDEPALRAEGAAADAGGPEADRPVVAHGDRHPRRRAAPARQPRAESECWAWMTSASVAADRARRRPGARPGACGPARAAGARAGRPGPSGPGSW